MGFNFTPAMHRERFENRHIGPSCTEQDAMLSELGLADLSALIDGAVPKSIRQTQDPHTFEAMTEQEALSMLKGLASENQIFRSYIGMGYYGTHLPSVIQRNILENPGWYTQYTPYQAEISQGRLEALLNFQTLVEDLTALPVANASLLDEATAAAEAMGLLFAGRKKVESKVFYVDAGVLPQTHGVLVTRAAPLGIQVVMTQLSGCDWKNGFGALIQYPNVDGAISNPGAIIERANKADCPVVMACDLLSLALLTPPGELGAAIAVGSAQRFGVPMGFGGPHAAFFATRDEWKRRIPGRIIGVSKDSEGHPAFRLALQTREQHIRREKATSNICTAQVLLAVLASMYAVYHGPEGIRSIARRVHGWTCVLAHWMRQLGYESESSSFFDTLTFKTGAQTAAILKRALDHKINLRVLEGSRLGISLDETVTLKDVLDLLDCFNLDAKKLHLNQSQSFPSRLEMDRTSLFLQHPVFSAYRSETDMQRYIRRLEAKDLSLTRSMIPLGSCTMKLNAATEMLPVTWEGFSSLHPFAPLDQSIGYRKMFQDLESHLCQITGFSAVSLQPNAGSQGEYAGLLVIKKFHESRGQHQRKTCLIPVSAHGTNPASAVMAGMDVVNVACDEAGNIDIKDLAAKTQQYKDSLAALMVTYPSTHGVFEEGIREICNWVHEAGGQVYMDGANMNAQIGLCRPAEFGADVCHLNLHKTFCIPHGGGGPGVGPICVKSHLAPFLPSHPLVAMGGEQAMGPVAAAPWGSASILAISYSYIRMMGSEGLRQASVVAILNANYMAKRLHPYFPVLYRGAKGLVAHECIIDLRALKQSAGIEVEDVAKRLMDFGFHAPTISWPVAGTMMIEPTESESKAELDRFCDAMIAIHAEAVAVAEGRLDKTNNPLKNAPHSLGVMGGEWNRPYSRDQAVFPLPWVKQNKFWPSVSRVDNAYGDRNLVCACPPWEIEAKS